MPTNPATRPRVKRRMLKAGTRAFLDDAARIRGIHESGSFAVLTFRLDRDWTQVEAAEWYGCSARTWRRWENAEVQIPRSVLNRIRAARSLRARTPSSG